MTRKDVAELYATYGYLLFRRCFAYLGDEAAAQDAVQEVFVRALRHKASFRGEASPRTWLYRIADHHCVDILRRSRRSPFVPAPGNAETAEQPALGPAAGKDVVEVLSARRAMAGLEAGARRLAILYYVDERTQEEVAEELGVSRRTIGKRLRALGRRMQALVGERESA